ncbi:CRISPR-associated protein Cas4 [Halobellus rufus]|uniref:CRISPR-associated protein Cas4 n=1 Tax=Halobellus rufus TaxID=1448860 RepID=UPI00067869F1
MDAASPADSSIPISHLARAAYCPRQLYYARRDDDHEPPPEVAAVRDLAFAYERHRTATDETLRKLPIAVAPGDYRANLASLAEREDYERLAAPSEREAFLRGRDCHGIVHKLLEPDTAPDAGGGPAGGEPDDPTGDGERGSPPTPTVVSPGDPPPQGVWEPQRVRAVAVAKALAWERERAVPRALVEYPAHGVVRTVRLTTRNKSAYRRTLWTVRSMAGVPARVRDAAKCDACEYRERCGTKTRSLKTLLGLG